MDDALYFCTSPPERKAKNLDHNPHCILTTGRNSLDGLDDAIRSGDSLLYRVAPVIAFGFGKGASFSQTRYRFP